MQELIVRGMASNTEIAKLPIQENDLPLTLMEFLQQNNIPIASSCLGEGVCSRCEVNDGLLSCQITLAIFIKRAQQEKGPLTISVNYL